MIYFGIACLGVAGFGLWTLWDDLRSAKKSCCNTDYCSQSADHSPKSTALIKRSFFIGWIGGIGFIVLLGNMN